MSEQLNTNNVLKSVYEVICSRVKERPEKSYVVSLFDKGLDKILSKVEEESRETIEAAKEQGQQGVDHLKYEICDLFFHSLVLAAYKGITYEQIEAELGRRFGVSGITEKESRKGNSNDATK